MFSNALYPRLQATARVLQRLMAAIPQVQHVLPSAAVVGMAQPSASQNKVRRLFI